MTIKELCKKQINCSLCPYIPICGDSPENYDLGDDLEVTDAIIKTAKELEQQPKTGHWVPVSEGMPSEGEDVIAWVESGDEVRIAYCNYAKGVWFDAIMNVIVSPVAWMPLPEPYEPQESEDKE